jgi:hypothetical protein
MLEPVNSSAIGTKKLIRCTSCHAEILPDTEGSVGEHHIVLNKQGFVVLLCGFCYISSKEHVTGIAKDVYNKESCFKEIIVPTEKIIRRSGRMPKLSPDQISALREDYRNGIHVRALLKKYGISTATAYKYYSDMCSKSQTSLSDKDMENIKIDFLRNNMSRKDIVIKYKSTPGAVHSFLDTLTRQKSYPKKAIKSDKGSKREINRPEIDLLNLEKKSLTIANESLAKQVAELKYQELRLHESRLLTPKKLNFREKLIKLLGGEVKK